VLLRLGGDHASPKGPVGDKADFLVVVVTGAIPVDAPEDIAL
jgi:hypothetical protein